MIAKKLHIYIALCLLAVAAVFPLFYMLTNSFMGAAEFSRFYGSLSKGVSGRNPLHFIPEWTTLEGYWEVFYSRPDYLIKFWSSLFISGSILAGQIVVAVLGGYAFSRFRFPGRDAIFFVIVVLMMLPLQVTLVPNFIVLDRFGLIGSYAALILPGMFSAFGVFLMRQIMLGLPVSIFEAAMLDGYGPLRSLWAVCLPNCKAGLAALVILNFADSWNMVEQPLVFLRDPNKFPMSVFLTQVNQIKPEVGFAAGILSVLPAMLLFLYFKDEMIMGIEYSAVK